MYTVEAIKITRIPIGLAGVEKINCQPQTTANRKTKDSNAVKTVNKALFKNNINCFTTSTSLLDN